MHMPYCTVPFVTALLAVPIRAATSASGTDLDEHSSPSALPFSAMTVLLRVCLLQFKFPPQSKTASPPALASAALSKRTKNSDVDGEHPRGEEGPEGKQPLTTR